MKLVILFAFFLLTAATCKNKGTSANQHAKSKKDTTFIDVKGNRYKMFGQIPDSLRTPEQEKFATSLRYVLVNGVVAENNHMVLKFTKEQCLAQGMKEKDYNDLQNNLRTNNHYFDSIGVKNIDSMINNMHIQLRASAK